MASALQRSIGEDEVKSCGEHGTSGLMGIKSFGLLKVLKVLMVCDDFEAMVSSLQPVYPLLKGEFDHQKLMIANFEVVLHRGHLFGVEGTLM